jgi:error-prone DNA polymerase
VWQRVAQQHRRVLVESVLLGVDGEVQAQGDVRHLVARRLLDYSDLLPELASQSRDFR